MEATTGAGDELFARVGDVELCYEELGDPDGEPLLLVMGLGAQMILWDRRFCESLGERGYRVIRFDNRDVGRSTHLRAPIPGRAAMLFGTGRPAYTLDDLADDAVGLLDALEIDSAHIVGASMGGMISQVVGYQHPKRVRSLGLIMTHSGRRPTSMPTWRAFGALMARPATDREGLVDSMVRVFKVIGSPGYPMDEEHFRSLAGATWDRGYNPAGTARQMHAITAGGNRTSRLSAISAPTVVIHGRRDSLVRPANGKLIARSIPGASLVLIDGMGHDLPEPVWPEIVDAISSNAARAAEPAVAV
jgi:pimeloyl-ACP methyl ester carboxylesterase